MRERVSAILAAVMLCVVALAAQTPAPAAPPTGAAPAGPPQGPPPKPKNLKILPEDIDHDQLIAIMRGFSGALGVRCTHCHVGQESDPRSMDFASDDKDEKKTSRDMLKMTEAINAIVGVRLRPAYELSEQGAAEEVSDASSAMNDEDLIDLIKDKFDASEVAPGDSHESEAG